MKSKLIHVQALPCLALAFATLLPQVLPGAAAAAWAKADGPAPAPLKAQAGLGERSAAPANRPLDANAASAEQLEQLPGIGPAMVQRILDERRKAPFRSLDDFDQRVKGVGPALLRKLLAAGLVVATPLDGGAHAPAFPVPRVQQYVGNVAVPPARGR